MDDKVRRCLRHRKDADQTCFQLNNEPRRKKGAAKKTVSISTIEDLKYAIVSRSLEGDMEAVEVEPIQATALLGLGVSFCDVPPM